MCGWDGVGRGDCIHIFSFLNLYKMFCLSEQEKVFPLISQTISAISRILSAGEPSRRKGKMLPFIYPRRNKSCDNCAWEICNTCEAAWGSWLCFLTGLGLFNTVISMSDSTKMQVLEEIHSTARKMQQSNSLHLSLWADICWRQSIQFPPSCIWPSGHQHTVLKNLNALVAKMSDLVKEFSGFGIKKKCLGKSPNPNVEILLKTSTE